MVVDVDKSEDELSSSALDPYGLLTFPGDRLFREYRCSSHLLGFQRGCAGRRLAVSWISAVANSAPLEVGELVGADEVKLKELIQQQK